MGVERIVAAFKKPQKILAVYVCAGDPDLETTSHLIPALSAAGADIIEIGVPFSDPIADGPTIQAASQRALSSGTNMRKVLELLEEVRSRDENLPLLLMTYYNPVFRYGIEEFAAQLQEKGGDGLIVPDLPVEEAAPLRSALHERGLTLIPLVAPTTPEVRLRTILEKAQGFVYCVSLTGVTGARSRLPDYLRDYLQMVRKTTDLPLLVGFGVSTPDQAAQLAPLADGVVVGSALIEAFRRSGLDGAVRLVQGLRAGLDLDSDGHITSGNTIRG
ncbi:MAG: Tryptophan synthase alpha chain [Thermoanaerobacterales bacterium 50_218]|nr:MAG: Tryptophan synthase alpha chain [Thermoanaerobacterales bacterium 50_218]HAA89726.1 tryptophan synthase subunit alpha [Peptococcaceae bacterium]